MISGDEFLGPAKKLGFNFFTGVPCSFLTPIINRVISDPSINYVGATNEGEAVAIAAGAWLSGRMTVVMCQNSGLGNTVNPLTSLNWPFRIPTLLIVTWRGDPSIKDEPQHHLMGEITIDLLKKLRIPYDFFPENPDDVEKVLHNAKESMQEKKIPFALIMKKGAVSNEGLKQDEITRRPRGTNIDLTLKEIPPTREDALITCLDSIPQDTAIICTTGKSGRELFTICDRVQHLYQVGSMGCASAMALGVALSSQRKIMVIDGDGAALMKMGNLATIGSYAPKNLLHLVLDNESHDSTGGQNTVSPNIDFSNIASGCGYKTTVKCNTSYELSNTLKKAVNSDGPHMIHMKISPGSMSSLGRPTIQPEAVARRFRNFLTS